MKHNFLKQLFVALSALMSTAVVVAQTEKPEYKELSPVTVTSNSIARMDEKVRVAFQKDFDKPTDVSWYKMDKNTHIYFLLEGIVHRILYNPRGKQIYHISYYEAATLPATVKSLLLANYPGFATQLALHVQQNGRDIWVANMEDEKKWLFIRIEDGDTEITNEMDRGDL